jgi:HKD family nuclease
MCSNDTLFLIIDAALKTNLTVYIILIIYIAKCYCISIHFQNRTRLKESPLLWSKERDTRLSKMKIEVPNSDDPNITDIYFLKKLQSDPNTWHIPKEGEEE